MTIEEIELEVFSDIQLDFDDYQEVRDKPNESAVNIHADRFEQLY